MLYHLTNANIKALLLGFYLRQQADQRRRELQAEIAKVKRRMAQRRVQAISQIIMLISQHTEAGGPRRVVERCLGKWRGSTISGYLRGDDQTYCENFRMDRKTFDKLLELVQSTAFATVTGPKLVPMGLAGGRRKRGRTVSFARAHTDPPSTRYKLAVCLYAMAQGGRFKLIGDAAGIGKSTVRKWMVQFCEAIMTAVKPIYMPGTPYSPAEREAVRGKFASRRGVPDVAFACDGTHIPFHPRGGKKVKMLYRNYKGWTSILSVAWVDSYHRFFDLHVGFPGRAGDNSVLARSRLMDQIREDPDTWLGPGGVILGDCGASDGDEIFLNPYHNPTETDACWFNFCHSSTRFFVEETFGRWKNRWRFLMDPCRTNHKLTTQMIYASAVLHNFCTAHPFRNSCVDLPPDMADTAWSTFLTEYDSHRCPTCRARNAAHCIHQSVYRNHAAQTAQIRKAPSAKRDEIKGQLWDWVSDGVTTARTAEQLADALGGKVTDACAAAAKLHDAMERRAQNEVGAYEMRVQF
jgi:hypothetical protein